MLMGNRDAIGQTVSAALIAAATGAAMLCAVDPARAGPCTAQIAQVEQQIHKAQAAASPGGAGTPSAPQSIGAQLHHQPTAQSIQQAQNMAAARAAAAIERARKADAEGDAQACTGALNDAKQLYGLQ
jgi:hypothetical protein